MKFNNGEWRMLDGVSAHNANQIRDARISPEGDMITFYAVGYTEDQRMLDGPMIEVRVSSPQRDVIRMEAVHFAGGAKKSAGFDFTDEHIRLDILEDACGYSVISGDTALIVKKRPSSFTFTYKGRTLTSVGKYFDSTLISYMETKNGPFMRVQLDVDVGEKIYGLGERFTPFVKNGQVVESYNEDGGTSSEIAYKSIPFYVTNKGYGVFVNETGRVSYELCSESVTRASMSVPGQKLEFMVFGADSVKGAISGYTKLLGRPALPPLWSFGLWLSSSFTTSYDENTVLSFVDGMNERGIPLSVFHFDCFWMHEGEWCGFEWDNTVFPDPKGLIEKLHARGLKVCVWINPYIGQKAPAFRELMDKNMLILRENGDVWQWDLWQPGLAVFDFTNPDTVEWYRDRLVELMRMGVDSFKTDFGERIPTDCVYHDGSDPEGMHNYYSYIYNKLVYDTIAEQRGAAEAAVFARSGTAGTQKFPVCWGGDNSSNYPSMAESLRGGLSLCLSGFGFWSHDIGGFEGSATPDVYKRWCAFGLLSSHSRLHGSNSYRVPWNFGEEAVDVCRHFVRLKNELMPYIYSCAVQAHETGVPMMRAMVMEFPGPAAEDCDRQYMLGDALLVAPVMRADGRVQYYLPGGEWIHYLSGEIRHGGWQEDGYDYFSLPLYVRENTILPVSNDPGMVDFDAAAGLTVNIYSLKEGARAQRTIVDREGKHALTLTAHNENGSIRIICSGPAPGLRIKLINCGCPDTEAVMDFGELAIPVCR